MNEPRAVGLCLGASTISVVEIEKKSAVGNGGSIHIVGVQQKQHDGDPKRTLSQLLDGMDLQGKYIGATGRKFRRILNIPSITEPEATEYAYAHVNPGKETYDAIVSAGAETFVVYQVDSRARITRIGSGNKCASGTGEFFLQQVRRMNISAEEAIGLARESAHPHGLSGRCSVFCKSDCTHALNKGVPIGDVAAGLARMISKKMEELLVKIGAQRVLVVGGTTRNDVVVGFLRATIDSVHVPPEAPYFEALGAALWALETKQAEVPERGKYYRTLDSSFEFLHPISEFTHLVDFKEMPMERPRDGDQCIVGLDVGSTTTKAVLFRVADEKIVASVYLRTNGNPIKASRECYRALADQLGGARVGIVGLGVTGSGRYISGLHASTDAIINEIIAHARAAAHFDPTVDTIYEIGGQDAKYTYLTNSVASDYAMNEACSAGTGSFLEESAQETLGVKMEDIAGIALSAKSPPDFSDQCAAFISSDINTAFQEGIAKEDIVAGLVYSICVNYANRVRGNRQTGNTVFMQGGVCYNRAVPIAMAGLIGKRIVVPPHPGLMGAYGVALEVKSLQGLGLSEPKSFNLEELAGREVEYGRSFVCLGKPENCDRKCEIAMIGVEGKKFPFGGACNKYYNKIRHLKVDATHLNHVERRSEMLFVEHGGPRKELPSTAPLVGINRAFHTHTLLPFYRAFFEELGCRTILPDQVRQTGIDKGMTSFCLPGQIALGMFEDLLDKKPDYVFLPQIREMHVSEQEEYRQEFQSTCMFIQGEPWYQRATFLRGKQDTPKLLAPILNLMTGYDAEEEQLARMAVDMGFSYEQGKRAHAAAYERLNEWFRALKAEGRKVMAEIESNPNEIAVVLFGRPYNAFADEANKGVPSKFSSRGIRILPYDFLTFEEEANFRDDNWEMGQKIIKAARVVKRHPQLFGCYLTNFLCALDSILVPHFRDLMQTKPSLTIEVDSHTADAGVTTRVEAFLDVVRNYLKMRDRIRDAVPTFRPSRTELGQTGKVTYLDSSGESFGISDPRVKVLVPSMGDLFAEGFATALRGYGWRAEALPVCDGEALELGRSVTTSKECLPIINMIGQMLKYVKYRSDPNEKTALVMISSGGACRVGQYAPLLKFTIEKLAIKDMALICLDDDDGFAGLGVRFRMIAAKSMYLFDAMADARAVIQALAVDVEGAMGIFNAETKKLQGTFDGTNRISTYRQLRRSVKELSRVRLRIPVSRAKYVGIVGEIFVRRDAFSLMGIPRRLAEQGFVMLAAPVAEWIRYTDFLRAHGLLTLKVNFIGKIEAALSTRVQDWHERRVKRLLAKTGLYEYELINIRHYMNHTTHYLPLDLTGEPGLSSGAALAHLVDKYCGTINVGPFGCMNSRMTESVATVEMSVDGKQKAARNAGMDTDYSYLKESTDALPFLSLELDGNPFSQIEEARFETFLLQANRLHQRMMEKRDADGKGRHAARPKAARPLGAGGNGGNAGSSGNGGNGNGSGGNGSGGNGKRASGGNGKEGAPLTEGPREKQAARAD